MNLTEKDFFVSSLAVWKRLNLTNLYWNTTKVNLSFIPVSLWFTADLYQLKIFFIFCHIHPLVTNMFGIRNWMNYIVVAGADIIPNFNFKSHRIVKWNLSANDRLVCCFPEFIESDSKTLYTNNHFNRYIVISSRDCNPG